MGWYVNGKLSNEKSTPEYSRHGVSDSDVVAFEISLNIHYISRSSAECKARPFV